MAQPIRDLVELLHTRPKYNRTIAQLVAYYKEHLPISETRATNSRRWILNTEIVSILLQKLILQYPFETDLLLASRMRETQLNLLKRENQ